MSGSRVEGWVGVAAAVLLLGGFTLPGFFPAPDADARELIGFFQEHRQRLLAAALAIGAGSFLFIWFLTGMTAWLRTASGRCVSPSSGPRYPSASSSSPLCPA